MLAALVLEVMDRREEDALKVGTKLLLKSIAMYHVSYMTKFTIGLSIIIYV